MYSNEKNVQILVGLLKKYNVSEIVLSPGGSDAPIVQSFQYDDFFHCYSVVDERNSIYFGIGISQIKNCPVACVCTAGTAVSNFLPGITEAYYQNVRIIAITADSPDYMLDQLRLQKIEQRGIFGNCVKKDITLPSVQTEEEEWACNRLCNETLLALDHHGKGPVHINLTIAKTLECNSEKLCEVKPVRRHDLIDYAEIRRRLFGKKVMIVVGAGLSTNEKLNSVCQIFFEHYNCIFSVETISNLRCDGCVTAYPMTETFSIPAEEKYIPDIVISVGNHIASYFLESYLRENRSKTENWLVNESGEIRDPYWSLSDIFEVNPITFIESIILDKSLEKKDHTYYNLWKNLYKKTERNIREFSSFHIAHIIAEKIPDGGVLHTAVLNSTRAMQFSNYLKKNIQCYCNLGALGIDGCVATFIGEAVSTKEPAYLLIGDLSFFYGMNGISIRGLTNNIRIILLNNGGGEEFKIKMNYPDIEEYVCASKQRKAKGWAVDCGFQYYEADNIDSVSYALDKFAEESDRPMFLEITIDMDKDAHLIRELYKQGRNESNEGIVGGIKAVVKKAIPDKYKGKAKEIYNIIRS